MSFTPSSSRNGSERRLRLRAAVDPEGVADAVPGRGEALLVGVRVLDHLPLEPVRVTADDAVADRSAVVLQVEPERVKPVSLEQALDDLGEPVERVVEAVGHVGVAEARVVGREDVEAVGERRDEVAELVRGGGEAAEQQQLGVRRRRRPRGRRPRARRPALSDAVTMLCSFRLSVSGDGPSASARTGFLRHGRKNPVPDDAQPT